MLDKWYKKEKPVFTGIARGIGGFAFGSGAGAKQIFPEEEYYFTGTNYDEPDNTGTLTVPGSCKTIKVSGTGTGGCGRDLLVDTVQTLEVVEVLLLTLEVGQLMVHPYKV